MNKGAKGTSKPTGHGTAAARSSTMSGGNIGAGGTTSPTGHGRAGSHGSLKTGTLGPRARSPRGFNVGGDHG